MNKLENILEQSVCPSDEILQLYAEKKLEANVKKFVERHIADCEICNDQIEGYQQIADTKKIDTIVNELNTKIKRRAIKKEHKIINFTTSVRVAAIIIIFILIGSTALIHYYVKLHKSKYLAINEQEKNSSMKDEVLKETKFEETKLSEKKDSTLLKINTRIKQKTINKQNEIQNKISQKEDNTPTISPEIKNEIVQPKQDTINILSLLSEDYKQEQELNSVAYGKDKDVLDDKKDVDIALEDVLLNESSKRDIRSKTLKESGIQSNKITDIENIYKNAEILYSNKSFTQCLNELNAVDFSGNNISDEVEFLKALCYKSLNQIEIAKQIFTKLAKEGNKKIRRKAESELQH